MWRHRPTCQRIMASAARHSTDRRLDNQYNQKRVRITRTVNAITRHPGAVAHRDNESLCAEPSGGCNHVIRGKDTMPLSNKGLLAYPSRALHLLRNPRFHAQRRPLARTSPGNNNTQSWDRSSYLPHPVARSPTRDHRPTRGPATIRPRPNRVTKTLHKKLHAQTPTNRKVILS